VKKIFLLYIIIVNLSLSLTLIPRSLLAAEQILIVQSIMIPPYENVVAGFESVCCNGKIHRLTVHDKSMEQVAREVRTREPALVVAIGVNALKKLENIERIPIVYCMVLATPDNPLSNGGQVTGVSINLPQDYQLRMFAEALPDVKTIGLLYDAERSGELVEEASHAAADMHITLVKKTIESAKEVAPALETMNRRIDAFWMLPDLTVINEVTVEHMLSFSVGNRIPLLTFSDKYVEQGALMSVSIDTFDIGVQTGELAEEILAGKNVSDIAPRNARKGTASVNLKVARKLNTTVDKKFIKGAMVID